jgi:hypothetical protein
MGTSSALGGSSFSAPHRDGLHEVLHHVLADLPAHVLADPVERDQPARPL